MYQKMLIAVDSSETSEQVLSAGLCLARKLGVSICVAHVVDVTLPLGMGLSYVPLQLLTLHRNEAKTMLDEAKTRAAQAGVYCETALLELESATDDVFQCLQRCAKYCGAELVVLGTHGRRGLKRAWLGSVAERFARESTCPVLLVPSTGPKTTG